MLENVYCSVDRLTILTTHNQRSSVYLAHKLREYLAGKLVNDLKLKLVNYQDGLSFGVSWYEFNDYDEEREENLIFIHVFEHGGESDLRIDFNPNSLKKHDVEYIWNDLRFVLSTLQVNLRLSRFDLAFDIINAPFIQEMKNIRGGTTRKEFYGRSGALETIYWGSQASSVQIRLYDKLVEIGGKIDELYDTIPELAKTDSSGRYLVQIEDAWRLEMQMRTKVIDENLADEVAKRLNDFTLTSVHELDLKPELRRFARTMFNDPKILKLDYEEVPERTFKRWKAKVREAVRKANDDNVEAIKKALQRDSEKLAKELKKYCDIYLGF
ncbi:TPA: hypothetical protein VAO63_002022 [Streptococcus agalactiae]|nr:hypothetical protein [Streptococcus agalactiae]HEO2314892.1 hypothetical protein [Streptococcus agalactiae]HEQ1070610.1 hypothetical protein [Streptococcus pyogenes]